MNREAARISEGVQPGEGPAPPASPAVAAALPGWEWPSLVGLAVVAVSVCYLYFHLFQDLAAVWQRDENYNHGPFVVAGSLVFAVMAWYAVGWPVAKSVPRGEFVRGAVQVGFGLLVHLYCWVVPWALVDTVTLIFVLRGTLLMFGGEKMYNEYGFATLFLVFMAPLPPTWYQWLAVNMQSLAAVFSTTCLNLLDIPCRREGYMIYLFDSQADFRAEPIPVEVGAACSGLRQLTAVTALALAIGHLSGRGFSHKLILGVLSVPVAVVSNCVRVFLTALILLYVGREYAEGKWHEMEGMIMVGLSSFLIMGLAWMLADYEDSRAAAANPAPAASAENGGAEMATPERQSETASALSLVGGGNAVEAAPDASA